jgi:hypothetical protein
MRLCYAEERYSFHAAARKIFHHYFLRRFMSAPLQALMRARAYAAHGADAPSPRRLRRQPRFARVAVYFRRSVVFTMSLMRLKYAAAATVRLPQAAPLPPATQDAYGMRVTGFTRLRRIAAILLRRRGAFFVCHLFLL